jgi:APA family basic amino acid/polyamine antiporter
VFQKVSPSRRVPVANTVIVALFISILAAVIPLGRLVDATSIGTLFAFALVSVGVIVLRRTRPDLPRGFRVPLYPVTPVLGVGFCVYLMVGLGGVTWVVFALWLLVGLAAYFLYGHRRSRLASGSQGRTSP